MQADAARKPESARPKTDSELAGEAGIADYNRLREREVREEQERLAKIARRRQQEANEKAAKERKAKLAQIAFQENAVLHEASDLSPAESQLFWERVTAIGAGLDAGAASIIAEEIRSARNYQEER
jgi:hypothetical protein